MSKLIMLSGLPAVGKSTKAKEIAKGENAVILSSDEMRIELFGNVNHQDDNGKLFEELYRRAKMLLKEERNVIIDATNINSKRRMSVTRKFMEFELECYYFNTPLYIADKQDKHRDKKVGFRVIDRMYRTLQVPSVKEGWNKIRYIHQYDGKFLPEFKSYLESVITQYRPYEELFYDELNDIDIFDNIRDLAHDSSYHSLSVSRHTYHVWEYIFQRYDHEDKLIMLWAALLHDIGKRYCKNFKEGSRFANFIGHENVGAQLSCIFLSSLGYDDDFVSKVVELVQLHMRLLHLDGNEEAKNKLKNFVGYDTYDKLTFLREADVQAH